MLSATKTRKQYRNKKMRKKALKSAYKRALNMEKSTGNKNNLENRRYV